MTFLSKLPALETPQEVIPLCFGILRNKIGNVLQKKGRWRQTELSEKDAPRDPHTPDTLLTSRERQARLRAALESLARRSEDDRKISQMLQSGFSLEEIRKAFGHKSITAVHTMLSRFRGRLKAALKGDLK